MCKSIYLFNLIGKSTNELIRKLFRDHSDESAVYAPEYRFDEDNKYYSINLENKNLHFISA